jgi:hypothetical protein
LSDHDGTAADNQDLLDVVATGHVFVLSAITEAVGE